MKLHLLSVLLLLVFSVTLFGQPDILSRKVRIESREGSIGLILDEISMKGGFYFSYNQDINRDRRVSISYKRQTVQEFLDELFEGNIYCVAYENKLLIKLKPEPPDFYTVRGKVIDSEKAIPLPGVNVIIPGSVPLIGGVTDDSGHFQIHVPREMDAIRFSCIGYESLNLNPSEGKLSTVELIPRKMEIHEAVIDSYRPPVKMESSVAISYLSEDKLERIRQPALEDMLQGSVAGIHVVRNSGMPGASYQVRIRGTHSLINSDPVYYLNGIPLQHSLLNAISFNDLASVEILKEASSTAIYGASAGNGVILLQSKRGPEDGIRVNLNYQVGTQWNSNELDLLHTKEFLEFSTKVRPENDYDWLDSAYLANDNDFMKLMFKPAKMEDLHVSVSGGGDRSQYYFGFNYFYQEATIKNLNFNRLSFHLNSSHQIGSRWEIGHHLNFAHMRYEGLKEGCFLNDHNNPVLQCFITPPFIADTAFFKDDELRNSPKGGTNQADNDFFAYEDKELINNLRKNYAFFGDLFSRLDLSRNISFETLFGYELLYQNNLSCNREKHIRIPKANNPILENEYQVLDLAYHWRNRLKFSEILAEQHLVEASLGFELGQSENEWIPVEQIKYSPGSGQNSVPVSVTPSVEYARTEVDYRHRAALGTLSYIFKERYILNGSLRRELVEFDSTATVSKQFTAWYPSLSLGWIFLKPKEHASQRILRYGKIRYGYGVAGNSPRLNYSFHANLMRQMAYVYSFNSAGIITNSADQRQANARFYWERIRSHNLGMELGFFNNQLFISTDFFRNHLDEGTWSHYLDPLNFLAELYGMNDYYGIVPLPTAEVVNSGIEGEIQYKNSGSLMRWDLSLHLTHYRNSIVDMDIADYFAIKSGSKDPISVNLPGKAAGSFFGYKIERLFREEDCPGPGEKVTNQAYISDRFGNRIYAQPDAEAGDYKFMDINQDSVIDENDRTVIGNPHPDFTFGILANIQFRNFDLSMFWQGSYGNEIFNATKLWLYNPYGTTNWSREILNSYGTPVYDDSEQLISLLTDTDLHRFDYLAENKNLRVSDFYIEDGSYLRLKNIQLGYTFDPFYTRRVHIEKLRIYICAQNLLTITAYSGLDPEVGGWGIDCGIYPQPRTFMAGITVEF